MKSIMITAMFLLGFAQVANATEDLTGPRAVAMAAQFSLAIPATLGALGEMHCNNPPRDLKGFQEVCYYKGTDRRASVMKRDLATSLDTIERWVFDVMGGKSSWSNKNCAERGSERNCTL